MPNIIGTYSTVRFGVGAEYIHSSGALSGYTHTFDGPNGALGDAAFYPSGINFNASKANGIYVDNGAVYPLSTCVNYIIKI